MPGNLLLGYFHVRCSGSFYASSPMVYALFTVSALTMAGIITTEEVGMGWHFVVAGVNGFMIGASMIYTLTHVLHGTPKESMAIFQRP